MHKPNFPLQQVAHRLSERASLQLKETFVKYPLLKQEHTIKLPIGLPDISSQYKQLFLPNFCVTTSVGDNCIGLKSGEIVIVQNIVKIQKVPYDIFIVFNIFKKKSKLFVYPWDSTLIGIYSVDELSENLQFCCIDDIKKKNVLLPQKKLFVALPLLHS